VNVNDNTKTITLRMIQRKVESLSIIIPVFNEEKALPLFLNTLKPVLKVLEAKMEVQILFVNNGSTDQTLKLILPEFSEHTMGVLSLSRNFGYEAAIFAGIENADTDLFAVIDADGEDNPEYLIDFLNSIVEGNSVAIGIRGVRFESLATRSFRKFGYRILSKVSDDSFIIDAGNFVMFDKLVKDAVLKENSNYPFMRSTIARSGFKTIKHYYDRSPRLDGKSKYRKMGLLKFAGSGFLSTTTWPLRMISYATLATVPIVVLIGFAARFLNFGDLPIVSITVVTTEILISVAIISIYLARIYKVSLKRPIYFIDPFRTFFHSNFKTSLVLKEDKE
jgi:glycosyltransferase involved in cell wall biosynthesis